VLAPRVLGTVVGGLIVVLNARTILLALEAPGLVRLVLLIGLGVGAAMLVTRSWIASQEERHLLAEYGHADAADAADAADHAGEVGAPGAARASDVVSDPVGER
jgi:hypothetical protein